MEQEAPFKRCRLNKHIEPCTAGGKRRALFPAW